MLEELSKQNQAERDSIIADIHVAFAGVVRGKHGISWKECEALDNYESNEACEAARRSDPDMAWSDLVEDTDWDPFPGIGGFSFINVQGFRYYLPPTMIRFLRGNNSEWFPGHLLGSISRFVDPHMCPPLWSEPQLQSIARFIAFMARHDAECRVFPDEPNPWTEAISKHWQAYLPR